MGVEKRVLKGYETSNTHRVEDEILVVLVYYDKRSEHYKEAINKLLFSSETHTSPLLKYDDSSLVMSPHLFMKVDVPGI